MLECMLVEFQIAVSDPAMTPGIQFCLLVSSKGSILDNCYAYQFSEQEFPSDGGGCYETKGVKQAVDSS